jgi:hypothetical protein
MRRAFAIAILCASIAIDAGADEHRLLLLSDDATFVHAVQSSLKPWGVTIATSSESLGPAMPRVAVVAHDLARDAHADAVAWISIAPDGAALWLYDAQTDQTSSRALGSPPPYEESRAASVALSLKTLLRATQVAPDAERVVEIVVKPPPPAPIENPPPISKPATVATRSSAWFVDAGLGARIAATDAAPVEPRLSLGFGRRFGSGALSLSTSFGTGAETASLRLTDVSLGFHARWMWLDSDRFVAGPNAAVLGRVLRLSGLADPMTRVDDLRFDVCLGAGAFAGVRISHGVALVLEGDAVVAFLRQSYYVRGNLVFDERPVFADAVFALRVEL